MYLTDDLPLDRQWIDQHGGDRKKACADLIEHALSAIFSRIDENRLLSIRLRSGQNKVLYRSDLISGAILASIVQRAKEQAIDRMIAAGGAEQGGMTLDDLVNSVHAEFREGEMLPPDDRRKNGSSSSITIRNRSWGSRRFGGGGSRKSD